MRETTFTTTTKYYCYTVNVSAVQSVNQTISQASTHLQTAIINIDNMTAPYTTASSSSTSSVYHACLRVHAQSKGGTGVRCTGTDTLKYCREPAHT